MGIVGLVVCRLAGDLPVRRRPARRTQDWGSGGVRTKLTAGRYGRTKLFLFVAIVGLWAVSAPLSAAVCARGWCDDGCDPATCHHQAAEATGATGDSLSAPGCTCSVHNRTGAEAVTPAADNAASRFIVSWLAAALPSVAPAAPPRPRLPHPESHLCKLLCTVPAATGWRAPPCA
jgi:hypothetical protein